MDEKSKSVFYARSQKIEDFLKGQVPALLEEGWVCSNPDPYDTAKVKDLVWISPQGGAPVTVNEAVRQSCEGAYHQLLFNRGMIPGLLQKGWSCSIPDPYWEEETHEIWTSPTGGSPVTLETAVKTLRN